MTTQSLLERSCFALFSAFIYFGLQVSVLSQQPTTPQQPSPVVKEDVVRIRIDLVQTDVTVLDQQGRFVEGLRPEQFQLLVDGKVLPISFFEQVKAGSNKEAALVSSATAQKEVADKSGGPLIGNDSSRGRTIFFFIDDLHLSNNSIIRTRQSLQRFVDNAMGPQDRLALTTASGQIGFLQQLTSDKTVLSAAIQRLNYRPYDATDRLNPPMTEYQALAIMNNETDVFQFFAQMQLNELCGAAATGPAFKCPRMSTGMTNNAVFDDSVARAGKSGGSGSTSGTSGTSTTNTSSTADATGLTNQAANLVRSRARIITARSAAIADAVLSSLESLIRGTAPLPERKLIIFISDGFFIHYLNSSKLFDLRRITDASIRSGSVIYTMDAHGLTSGVTDASSSGIADRTGSVARVNMGEQTALQNIFHTLAADTGGDKWINSNALDPGITRAIRETDSYYLIGWRPERLEQTKEEFRKLTVRVKDRSDLVVRVRSGFLDTNPDPAKRTDSSAAKATSPDDELLAVVNSAYPKVSVPTTLSLGFLHQQSDGLVLAASLQIDNPEADARPSEFDVLIAAVNDTGKILSTVKRHLTAPAGQAAAEPTIFTAQFPNLSPGLYQVRAAARESQSGNVGSSRQWIEIPGVSSGELTMSSIFLTEVSEGKAIIKPDRRFSRTTRLRFQTFVYGASLSTGSPLVTLQMRLQRNGEVIVETPPGPVSAEGVKDFTRLPVAGEFPLSVLAQGSYELKLTITDSVTKKTVSQKANFTVL